MKLGLWGNQKCVFWEFAALCAALGGCATKYQEMGFSGGVAAQQITADTWRIQSRGNAYTGASTVQDYVLLKAAETTQAAGGTHFQIVSAADASRASTFVTPGSSTTTFVGNQAYKHLTRKRRHSNQARSRCVHSRPENCPPARPHQAFIPLRRLFNLPELAFNGRADPKPSVDL